MVGFQESSSRVGPRLFFIHSASRTVVRARSLGQCRFAGPLAPEWVPYVFPETGYRLTEPVPGAGSEEVETILSVQRLNTLEVWDAATKAPVKSLQVISYCLGSRLFESAARMQSPQGLYPLWPLHSYSNDPLGRLLQSEGYRSVWIGPEVRGVGLVAGEDPRLVIQCERSCGIELTPVATDQKFPSARGDSGFKKLLHEGSRSEHRVPAGSYLLEPNDPMIGWTRVHVHPARGVEVTLRSAATMSVEHSLETELIATDRFGRRVRARRSEWGGSTFSGLAYGAVLVESPARPELAQVFEFREEQTHFIFICEPLAEQDSPILLSDGWGEKPSSSGDQTWRQFVHENGCQASVPRRVVTAPLVLAPQFTPLEFRIDGIALDGAPRVSVRYSRFRLSIASRARRLIGPHFRSVEHGAGIATGSDRCSEGCLRSSRVSAWTVDRLCDEPRTSSR